MGKHLDGRVLVIKSRPGEVIKPEMNTTEALPFVKVLPDEGMPSRGNPFVRGNLFIMFRVKFPEDNELPANLISELRKILPEPDAPEDYDPEEVEEVHLNHADLRSFGKGGQTGTAARLTTQMMRMAPGPFSASNRKLLAQQRSRSARKCVLHAFLC